MKYIKVNNLSYISPNTAASTDGKNWLPLRPELYHPNLKEWFIHYVLRKHFTFGQPFCVVCGKKEKVS